MKLAIYDIDEDDEGCARLHVNTNAPYATAEADACARVTTAAPALLEALEGINNNFASTDNNGVIITVRQLEQARAAIEQAKF